MRTKIRTCQRRRPTEPLRGRPPRAEESRVISRLRKRGRSLEEEKMSFTVTFTLRSDSDIFPDECCARVVRALSLGGDWRSMPSPSPFRNETLAHEPLQN
ncbi:hypothetical protein EVAR_21661_1 [Eumeta japonica]|uniref:Uncharacterized protein n=1 Tax=Eumeta variegata TaxID=151549 RepID=A0A4C1VFB8_EUMVA|nr:hypothetical protein EVAR_21661_1 [Eumeta japonica]